MLQWGRASQLYSGISDLLTNFYSHAAPASWCLCIPRCLSYMSLSFLFLFSNLLFYVFSFFPLFFCWLDVPFGHCKLASSTWSQSFPKSSIILTHTVSLSEKWFIDFRENERKEGRKRGREGWGKRERETLICYSTYLCIHWLTFFRKILFLERGEGREKERERNINVWLPLAHPLLGTWPATQAYTLTGNRTSDPLVHGPALSPLSHTSRDSLVDSYMCRNQGFNPQPWCSGMGWHSSWATWSGDCHSFLIAFSGYVFPFLLRVLVV